MQSILSSLPGICLFVFASRPIAEEIQTRVNSSADNLASTKNATVDTEIVIQEDAARVSMALERPPDTNIILKPSLRRR
jgi:hypothetical protein